jgi:hypothetical protein
VGFTVAPLLFLVACIFDRSSYNGGGRRDKGATAGTTSASADADTTPTDTPSDTAPSDTATDPNGILDASVD